MNKEYINLFKELAHSAEILAERVIELDHAANDSAGEKTATQMRDDYANLYDILRAEDFNGILTRNQYAKLLAASYIVVNNLIDRVAAYQKSISEYKTGLIPKLQQILDECPSDTEVTVLAEKIFN